MPITPHTLLPFLHRLYTLQSVNSLVEVICTGLTDFIGGENVMMGVHDGPTRSISSASMTRPFTRMNELVHATECGIMAQCPFWDHVFKKKTPVLTLSEILTAHQWNSHPIYTEVLREDGIRDQINLVVEGNYNRFTTINLLRSSREFSDKEIQLFTQLHPHFSQAYANAKMAESSGLALASSEGNWSIPVSYEGNLMLKDDQVAKQLHCRFKTAHYLPEEVLNWIKISCTHFNCGLLETTLRPFKLKQNQQEWQFTLHRQWHSDSYQLCICPLQHLPNKKLSPREMEVMEWVSQGKSNSEISLILHISTETVKTHLKRIYQKLNVENRMSASRSWQQRSSS
ncbi:helix-turn-helix transcriptional regulator [Kiritimatiellota bacterium B12222]|nr:helix-turn-helix transcriptional regulator [Kiritimatiellota bacterium B12222]